MALTDLLKLPDLSAALKCDPCAVQRERVRKYKAEAEKTGAPTDSRTLIAQLGWDPELSAT